MDYWMLGVFVAVAAGVYILTRVLRRSSEGINASREAAVRASWKQDTRRMTETPLYHAILEPATGLNRDHLQPFGAARTGYDAASHAKDADATTAHIKGMRTHLASATEAAREVARLLGVEREWDPVDGTTGEDVRYRPPRPPVSGSRGSRWELEDEVSNMDRLLGECGMLQTDFWNAFLLTDEESQRAAARDPAIRCAEGMETALGYLARIEDRLRIS